MKQFKNNPVPLGTDGGNVEHHSLGNRLAVTQQSKLLPYDPMIPLWGLTRKNPSRVWNSCMHTHVLSNIIP